MLIITFNTSDPREEAQPLITKVLAKAPQRAQPDAFCYLEPYSEQISALEIWEDLSQQGEHLPYPISVPLPKDPESRNLLRFYRRFESLSPTGTLREASELMDLYNGRSGLDAALAMGSQLLDAMFWVLYQRDCADP